VALAEAVQGARPALIHARIDELDDATHDWAGRRMDRAIAGAIAGKQVGDIEAAVRAAKGVDQHVKEHAAGGGNPAPEG